MSNKPYVVTDDLRLVVDKFRDAKGLYPPSAQAMQEASAAIRDTLKTIFDAVDIISAEEISNFLIEQAAKADLPVISMSTLVPRELTAGELSMSRSVALTRNGKGPRFQSMGAQPRYRHNPPVQEQFNRVSGMKPGPEVAIIDDVVFTGGTIVNAVDALAKRGIAVKKIIANVAMTAAINRLSMLGIETVADRVYEDVIDEVCARDFLVGMPEGGRNVLLPDGQHACAPYIQPFGDTGNWASIPEDARENFSRRMLETSHAFWSEMENANGQRLGIDHFIKPLVYWPKTPLITEGIQDIVDKRRYQKCFARTL